MQRAYLRAASWSLARLAGSIVSPPPICMYFWHALCAAFIFGSLELTLPPESLMPPLPHALRVGHVDAVLAHALGELQGALEGLVLPARRRWPAAAAVVGAAAGAERQGGADRGEEEW